MNRTILILNSGDGTGLNFTRCLRKVGGWTVIGMDSTLADYHGSEADIRLLFDWQEETDLIEHLQQLLQQHRPDLLYVADTGRELLAVSAHRDKLPVPMYLPAVEDHLRMEDKWLTWLALRDAGLPVPDTALATDERDIAEMLDRHGRVWLRRVSGSAGAGSAATDSLAFATAWLDREDGWGRFTVAQQLTRRTATFSGLWHNGILLASQLRERMGWKYPALSVSGVTGITGAQRTIWDAQLHELAIACVRALNAEPHGAIGVDFTYDDAGRPLPTEVQPARFYSSMAFLAEVGLNLPALYCDVALSGPVNAEPLINPVREEHYWIKGVERLPELLTRDQYLAR